MPCLRVTRWEWPVNNVVDSVHRSRSIIKKNKVFGMMVMIVIEGVLLCLFKLLYNLGFICLWWCRRKKKCPQKITNPNWTPDSLNFIGWDFSVNEKGKNLTSIFAEFVLKTCNESFSQKNGTISQLRTFHESTPKKRPKKPSPWITLKTQGPGVYHLGVWLLPPWKPTNIPWKLVRRWCISF